MSVVGCLHDGVAEPPAQPVLLALHLDAEQPLEHKVSLSQYIMLDRLVEPPVTTTWSLPVESDTPRQDRFRRAYVCVIDAAVSTASQNKRSRTDVSGMKPRSSH